MKDFFPRQHYKFWQAPGKSKPDYVPASNDNVANCEFYVNKFGRGYTYNLGYSCRWIEADVCVPAQDTELLGVGMWIRYQENDVVEECFSFGHEIETNYWKTNFTFSETGDSPTGHYKIIYDNLELAFFTDIRRPTGEIVRLWQSRSGANYTINKVFARSYSVSLGRGSMDYADESSVIFDVKRTCSRYWCEFSSEPLSEIPPVTVNNEIPNQDSIGIVLKKAELTPSVDVRGWYGVMFEVETDGLIEGEQVVLSFDDGLTVSATNIQTSRSLESKRKKWFFQLDNIGNGLSNFSIDRRSDDSADKSVKGCAIYNIKTPSHFTGTEQSREYWTSRTPVKYWASRSKEFLDWKLSQKVRLVWAHLIPDTSYHWWRSARVFIEVENIAYDKTVFLENGGRSVAASYYCTVSNNKEIWLWVPEYSGDSNAQLGWLGRNAEITFIIGYTVAGQTYWDDNGGWRYKMEDGHSFAPADW